MTTIEEYKNQIIALVKDMNKSHGMDVKSVEVTKKDSIRYGYEEIDCRYEVEITC